MFYPIHILNQTVTLAASVLNVGVTFDENVNLNLHTCMSKTCPCFCFTKSAVFALFAVKSHFPLLRPMRQLL